MQTQMLLSYKGVKRWIVVQHSKREGILDLHAVFVANEEDKIKDVYK